MYFATTNARIKPTTTAKIGPREAKVSCAPVATEATNCVDVYPVENISITINYFKIIIPTTFLLYYTYLNNHHHYHSHNYR